MLDKIIYLNEKVYTQTGTELKDQCQELGILKVFVESLS